MESHDEIQLVHGSEYCWARCNHGVRIKLNQIVTRFHIFHILKCVPPASFSVNAVQGRERPTATLQVLAHGGMTCKDRPTNSESARMFAWPQLLAAICHIQYFIVMPCHARDISFPLFKDKSTARNICKVSGIPAAVTEERLEAPWRTWNQFGSATWHVNKRGWRPCATDPREPRMQ